MPISQEQVNRLYDAEVVDMRGVHVGSLARVYVDDVTGEGAWGAVRPGWFGGRELVVPLANAVEIDGRVELAYDEDQVRDAPAVEADEHLGAAELEQLVAHYALSEGPAPAG